MSDPKPIVLVYKGGDTNSTLKSAEMATDKFTPTGGHGAHTGTQKFTRLDSGLYRHTSDMPDVLESASALDAITTAIQELSHLKGTKKALVIKDEAGKVIKTMDDKEAATFLAQQKTRELSQDHAVQELKGIIQKLATSNGGVNDTERDSLEQYASTHKLKLNYTEVKGGLDSIQIQNSKGTTLDSVKKINTDGNAR